MEKSNSPHKLIANRYQLHEQLGAGGMGTVFRGVDTKENINVAIKLLNLSAVAFDSDILERFIREGEVLRQLNHPNIVKILAAIEEEGNHYLIIELVTGGDLRNLLQGEGKLSMEHTLQIALDLADALTRAHRQKIVHRDLKPANVLIAQDGTPRLTDFGIARMMSEAQVTGIGTLLGTPAYLSPEALDGEVVDSRTDIWAFGVMLFEMLSGRLPFRGENVSQMIVAALTEPTPDLESLCSDISVALADLIYRMLEKDRNVRIPSIRLVGAELEAIIEGTEVDTSKILPKRDKRFASATESKHTHKHNLPAQTISFMGRSQELTELGDMVQDDVHRLVTIMAPGGMGKTRLAIEVAKQHLDVFPDGVYFVPLQSLSVAENLVSSIAKVVGYQFQQDERDPLQQLLTFLREKTLLLILDHFERIPDGVNIVDEILRSASEVQVFATSRERLNLHGETVFRIEGMSLPLQDIPGLTLEYDAIKLFIHGAQRVQPDFEPSVDELPYIMQICQMVQGLPLGILLAAAWIEMLSAKEIAEEINQSIDFLETDMHNVPERHRSIRAVFESSWNLLTDKERISFMKLSVFRGGFTRDAAQTVADANLRVLMALVNRSMLRRNPDTGRYIPHELLRQYAEEQLYASGSAEATQDNHMDYYLGFLEKRSSDLKGKRQLAGVIKIDIDFENARTAWHRAVEQKQFDNLNRVVESLKLYVELRNRYQERDELFRRSRIQLFQAGTDHPLNHRLLVRQMSFMRVEEHNADELQMILEATQEIKDKPEEAYILFVLGDVANRLRDFSQAITHYEASLTLFREVGDRYFETQILNRLGLCYGLSGRPDKYYQLGQESMQIAQETGNRVDEAWALHSLATVAAFTGQWADMRAYFERANKIWRDFDHLEGIAASSSGLGWGSFQMGDFERTRELSEEALDYAQSIQHIPQKGFALALFAFIETVEENYEQGNTLWHECREYASHHPTIPFWGEWGIGAVACGLEDYATAEEQNRKALAIGIRMRVFVWAIVCLPVGAILRANAGNWIGATEIISLALTHPTTTADSWMRKWPLVQHFQKILKLQLGADAFESAWQRGQSLDLETVVHELLAEAEENL